MDFSCMVQKQCSTTVRMVFFKCQFCYIKGVEYKASAFSRLDWQRLIQGPHLLISCSYQDRSRVSFSHGDACNLPEDLGEFGCVLAANLVCRLPNPYQFLDRLPSLVAPGGTLIITSPYSWCEQFTPKVRGNKIVIFVFL